MKIDMEPGARSPASILREVIAEDRARFSGDTDVPQPRYAGGDGPSSKHHVVGTRIGRYLVIERLGGGAMGVVYRVRDPELGRDVALKLVRGGHLERLKREAVALARLSHPNVVTVHEVGTWEDQVYVAMELIDGRNLREWLEEAKPGARGRSWREVLEVMRAAGRGLEAAHRVGLVHRDFKPENVMVGRDGRVRVVDFGLAMLATDPNESVGEHEGSSTESNALVSERLTATGTMVGTPLYIAPERVGGGVPDGRSDQFSYCVSSWEALYGERPFAGNTFLQLVAAAAADRLRAPSKGSGVPRWLHRVCARGLAGDPERRWPSMTALLEGLERERVRARRRWILAGVAAIGLAGLSIVAARAYDEHRRTVACADEAAVVERDWSEDVRARFEAALLGTDMPYARRSAATASEFLRAYADDWQRTRFEACMTTNVRRAWDPETADRASWCLDEHRMRLSALVIETIDHPAPALPNIVGDAFGLPGPDECIDPRWLALSPTPPAEVREQVRALRADLDRSHYATTDDNALQLTRSVLARARELEWTPLTIDGLRRTGDLLEKQGAFAEAETMFEEAYFLAMGGNLAPTAAAEAARSLVFIVSYRLGRHADGLRWSKSARAALVGLPSRPLLEGNLHAVTGNLLQGTADFEGAKQHFDEAFRIWSNELGPTHPTTVLIGLNNLALVHMDLGDYAEASRLLERALDLGQSMLGREHPRIASSLNNWGYVLRRAGRLTEARDAFARVVSILEATSSPSHPLLQDSLHNIAVCELELGNTDIALQYQSRVLATLEETLGPDHIDVAFALITLGAMRLESGAHAEARPLLERALAIRRTVLGPEHPDVGHAHFALASADMIGGDLEEARARFERAIAMTEGALGPNSERLIAPYWWLSQVELSLSRHADALRHAERGVAIASSTVGAPGLVTMSQFVLAIVRSVTSKEKEERARARAAAQRAYHEAHENIQLRNTMEEILQRHGIPIPSDEGTSR